MSGERWRADNAEWLRLRLQIVRLELQRRALWLHRVTGTRSVDWLLAADDVEAERRFFVAHAEAHAFDQAIAALDAKSSTLEQRMRGASTPPALVTLTDLAGLSAFERRLLLLVAAPALDGAFARAFAELHDDHRATSASLHLALTLFAATAAERVLAADCLTPGRALRALRLIEIVEESTDPILIRSLRVDERVVDYLRGLNRLDERLRPLVTAIPSGLSSVALDGIAARVSAVVADDRERWTTVNLLGSVAAGARDVAALATAPLGITVYQLDLPRLSALSAPDRQVMLSLLGREAVLGAAAILVDTADVSRGSPPAAVVDEVVATVGALLFLVSPERWPGEHAARVFRVSQPTRAEQKALWIHALSRHPHSVNGEIDSIIQQFDFGPPVIAAAVARAQESGPITGPALWEICRTHCGTSLDQLASRITPCYGWNDLVVSDDVRAQLEEVASQVEQRGRVYETWGFGAKLGRGRGISALFAGPSGAGKTMAAEILASHLSLDLYRIDLAGMISKYLGDTEKNCRRVFDAAERSGAILFFDEADALFGSRTEDVKDSHDRYANFLTNDLLQRMEQYAGLAILATNRKGSVDSAFLRRLRFVIDFPFPSVADRQRIWRGVFPDGAELDGVEYAFLAGLQLTGGNIRSVAVNAAFLAAGEGRPIGMRHVTHAAAREYTKLSRPISAAEFGPYAEALRS